MIDLHSHLVYGVDDGSKDIEDSIKMIEEAKKIGFTDIILTPHYMEDYYEVEKEEIANRIEKIKNMLQQREIKNISLYQGNEIYITSNMSSYLREEIVSTINDTKYVLFEMPMQTLPIQMEEVVYSLLESNKIPIIAHPERYNYVQENPNLLIDWMDQGILFQANYGSIVGQYGKQIQKTVYTLLEHNMIQFLGSDNHRVNSVYPLIPQAIKMLEKLISKEKIEEIIEENPRKVLEGQEIEIEDPIMIKKNKWKFW